MKETANITYQALEPDFQVSGKVALDVILNDTEYIGFIERHSRRKWVVPVDDDELVFPTRKRATVHLLRLWRNS